MARPIGQYVAKDSRGISRVLWGQEWGSSCGPASCYMTCCSVTQSTLGGGEAFMRTLAMKYGASVLDLMTGGPGTDLEQLKKILSDNHVRVDGKRYAEAEYLGMIRAASERKPIIFHVAWLRYDGVKDWVRSGGHWVVCVGTIGDWAVILDPWYGLREIPLIDIPTYNPDTPNQSKSTASGSWGQLSGWLLRVI